MLAYFEFWGSDQRGAIRTKIDLNLRYWIFLLFQFLLKVSNGEKFLLNFMDSLPKLILDLVLLHFTQPPFKVFNKSSLFDKYRGNETVNGNQDDEEHSDEKASALGPSSKSFFQ